MLPNAPKDPDDLEAIKAEAEYFGLLGLVELVSRKKETQEQSHIPAVEYKVITLVLNIHSASMIQQKVDKWVREGYAIKETCSKVVTYESIEDDFHRHNKFRKFENPQLCLYMLMERKWEEAAM